MYFVNYKYCFSIKFLKEFTVKYNIKGKSKIILNLNYCIIKTHENKSKTIIYRKIISRWNRK